MSEFTKTLIVDSSLQNPVYPYYNSIKKAAQYFINHVPPIGGVIIVERGTYTFDEEDDYPTNNNWRTTVYIPSNVTIIGRGNAVIEVNNNVPVFKNADQSGGNERITISGFKIVVKFGDEKFSKNVIDLKAVTKCVIEKMYITYDQTKTNGVHYENAAIAIWGSLSPERYSRDTIIRQCSVVDYGKLKPADGKNNCGMSVLIHTKCERNLTKFTQFLRKPCHNRNSGSISPSTAKRPRDMSTIPCVG